MTPSSDATPSTQIPTSETLTMAASFQIPVIKIDAAPEEDVYTAFPTRSSSLRANTPVNIAFANSSLGQNQSPIRRWRGPGGGHGGSLFLRVPNSGATTGSRLALARQGIATGSYKLNCSETVFADGKRKVSFYVGGDGVLRRRESNDEGLGEREKPPEKDEKEIETTRSTNDNLARNAMRMRHPPPKLRPRLDVLNQEITGPPYSPRIPPPDSRPATPTTSFINEIRSSLTLSFKHKPTKTNTGSKLSSSNPGALGYNSMARSYTFTEGLCNLADADDGDDLPQESVSSTAAQAHQGNRLKKSRPRLGLQPGMRTSFSVTVFGSGSLRKFAQRMDTKGRKWIDSLKRFQMQHRKTDGSASPSSSLSSLSSEIDLKSLNYDKSTSHRPVLDIFPELRAFNINFSLRNTGNGHGENHVSRQRKRRSWGDLFGMVPSKSKEQAHDHDCGNEIGTLSRSASLPTAKLDPSMAPEEAVVVELCLSAERQGGRGVTVEAER